MGEHDYRIAALKPPVTRTRRGCWRRCADLLARDRRKVHQGDGLPPHLVVIDELSLFTQAPVKDRETFNAPPVSLAPPGSTTSEPRSCLTRQPPAAACRARPDCRDQRVHDRAA